MSIEAAALERMRAFAGLLIEANQRLNLTRITAPQEVLEKHLLDALLGAPLLCDPSPPESLVDVGSGGGVPGLPLAALWPECRVLLVESEQRKAEFLREAARALGLARVEVCARRAEVAGHDPALRERFAAATLRAVGPLATCLELGLPFVRTGGRLVLYRGPGEESPEASEPVAARLGGQAPEVVLRALPDGAERRLVRVLKVAPTPATFPRRDGVPAKRPLGA